MMEKNRKIKVGNLDINYQDIYCFQPIEEYMLKRTYNPLKMLYGFIFAPVLPINCILDDEYDKSNYAVCKKLLIKVWLHDKPQPIEISFLPEKKSTLYVISFSFKKIYLEFKKTKDELNKIFEELYAKNYQQILQERINKIETNFFE